MRKLINQLSSDDWIKFMFSIKDLQTHLSNKNKDPLRYTNIGPLDEPLFVSLYKNVVIQARKVGLYFFGEEPISLIPGIGKLAESPYILVLTPVYSERKDNPQKVHVLAILKGPTLKNLRERITQAVGV